MLELRGVTKHFGAVLALHEVDFHVNPGEVMALVGDNGAGKSTLIKCVAGIHHIDGGEILFDGKPVNIAGPHEASALGIEVVYQDLALADNLDVVQNMFLGREELEALHTLDETEMESRALKTLDELSVTTIRSVRQTVAGLSGGQRQSVAVAKAVMWNSRVVILDEPTAALGVAQTRQVLDLVKRLGEQGLGVVIDLPQPSRRLRGGRLDHGPAPRPERGRVQAHRDEPAGGRPGDHRRASSPRCPAGRRRRGGGRREHRRARAAPAGGRQRCATSCATGGPTSASGELGSLPIIFGLIIIAIVFQSQNDRFLTAGNFVNLIVQSAAYHDDRHGHRLRAAAGRDRPVGGLRVRRGGRDRHRAADPRRQRGAHRRSRSCSRSASGIAIGTFHGLLFAKVGIPSFVVTLAGLIAWNGVVLLLIGSRGTVILQDDFIIDLANGFLSEAARGS